MALLDFSICTRAFIHGTKDERRGAKRRTMRYNKKADFRLMKRVSERNEEEKDTSRKGRKVYGDCWEVEYGYFTTGWIIAPTSGFLSFGLKQITFGRSSCEPLG